jgi:hypothetical protein
MMLDITPMAGVKEWMLKWLVTCGVSVKPMLCSRELKKAMIQILVVLSAAELHPKTVLWRITHIA